MKFIQSIRLAMKKNRVSIRALADRAGCSRGTITDVLAGKYVPSQEKLDQWLDALEVDDRTRQDIASLRNEAKNVTRAKKPTRRLRKNLLSEKKWARSVSDRLVDSGFRPVESDSPDFHFSIEGPNEKSAVAFRERIESFDTLFVSACQTKRTTGARRVAVVVRELPINPLDELFLHHEIRLMTEDGLHDFLKLENESYLQSDLPRGII